MKILKRTSLAIMLGCTLLSSGLQASGSFSGGSASGLQNTYTLGKSVFHRKLVCSSCPLAGQELNRDSANKLIHQVEDSASVQQVLSGKERKAVIHYIQKRFPTG
ncbi:MAG: hypothetical protein MI864_15030 [Pseudomonadales bacterium]|nr:hypothetical protein [Pseudomonadales bacterium]